MGGSHAIRKDLLRVVALALLSLFLIPALTLGFVRHAQSDQDSRFVAAVERQIDGDARLPAAEKTRLKKIYRAEPPSLLCAGDEPALAEGKAEVCERFSSPWQFHVAGLVAVWALVGGAAVLLAELALGALALNSRRAQYLSFAAGWRLLSAASALAVISQGAMVAWLSFWVTSFFFHMYSIKLIAAAGIVVGGAVLLVLAGMRRRPALGNEVEGEVIAEADAPVLWANVRRMAARLKTPPPRHIVAGIDANFFVTEAPVIVGETTLEGRTLYVSLPLLRLLDKPQANAVLGHELAHFRGGDAASSAKLGPKLVQYDHYLAMMHSGGLTRVVYHLMALFRVIFEFALKRDSRRREFKADRTAAKLVSPRAIVESLVKITAYASYRDKIERGLFEQDRRHGNDLGIAQVVASGLAPYAASPKFVQEMGATGVPHPFDSHPAMVERMVQVKHLVKPADFAGIVNAPVVGCWADEILTAAEVEQRLWSSYENHFAADHERTLAYRYEPETDTERELVLRYFPPVRFDLKDKRIIVISYSGMQLPGSNDELPWDSVTNLGYENGMGGDVLTITHPEKGLLGARTTKVRLPGISAHRDAFKQAMGSYWHRHQVMRGGLAD